MRKKLVPASETYSEPCEASKMELFAKIVNSFQLLRACFPAGFLIQKQPPGVFCKKDVLKNCANFTKKHLCQSRFFKKVPGLRPATLLKRRLWHRCFPVNFEKFLRTSFLQNTSGRVLISLVRYLNECLIKKTVGIINTPLNYIYLLRRK